MKLRLIKKISNKVEEMEKNSIETNKKFRLMYQDEAGFGRINKPRACWCIKGIRPVVPSLRVREYVYTYTNRWINGISCITQSKYGLYEYFS